MTSFTWFIVLLAVLAIVLSTQSRRQEGRSPGLLGWALWAALIIPPALAVPFLFVNLFGGAVLLAGWLAFWLVAGIVALIVQGVPIGFRAILTRWRTGRAPFYIGAAVFVVWLAAIIFAGHSGALLHH